MSYNIILYLNIADTSITIWVSIISASSAIVAVVTTQIITAINTRKSDNRKEKAENKRTSIKRRIEIGENFYHMFRESSLNLHKLKTVFINERFVESEGGLVNLTSQRKQIDDRALKLVEDTKLWNLTDIYFNVESTGEVTAKDVIRIMELQAIRIELDGQYLKSAPDKKEKIGLKFIAASDDVIELITNVIARVERDLAIVKKELIRLTTLMEQ
jgi:hypothetical protein